MGRVEVWSAVPGVAYEASSHGRVRPISGQPVSQYKGGGHGDSTYLRVLCPGFPGGVASTA